MTMKKLQLNNVNNVSFKIIQRANNKQLIDLEYILHNETYRKQLMIQQRSSSFTIHVQKVH